MTRIVEIMRDVVKDYNNKYNEFICKEPRQLSNEEIRHFMVLAQPYEPKLDDEDLYAFLNYLLVIGSNEEDPLLLTIKDMTDDEDIVTSISDATYEFKWLPYNLLEIQTYSSEIFEIAKKTYESGVVDLKDAEKTRGNFKMMHVNLINITRGLKMKYNNMETVKAMAEEEVGESELDYNLIIATFKGKDTSSLSISTRLYEQFSDEWESEAEDNWDDIDEIDLDDLDISDEDFDEDFDELFDNNTLSSEEFN